jgi:hypothetical protein
LTRPRTSGKPGRQPLRDAEQDQDDQPARERHAEGERTTRQVRVSRQPFAEPLSAWSARRVTDNRFAPPLEEPDDGPKHDGGAEDHEKGSEPFLSVTGTLRMLCDSLLSLIADASLIRVAQKINKVEHVESHQRQAKGHLGDPVSAVVCQDQDPQQGGK